MFDTLKLIEETNAHQRGRTLEGECWKGSRCRHAKLSALRKDAIGAQRQKPFNPEDVPDTLRDPGCADRKQLTELSEAGLYKDLEARDVAQFFIDDFKYWEERHFEGLKARTRKNLRDILKDKELFLLKKEDTNEFRRFLRTTLRNLEKPANREYLRIRPV